MEPISKAELDTLTTIYKLGYARIDPLPHGHTERLLELGLIREVLGASKWKLTDKGEQALRDQWQA